MTEGRPALAGEKMRLRVAAKGSLDFFFLRGVVGLACHENWPPWDSRLCFRVDDDDDDDQATIGQLSRRKGKECGVH